MNNRILVTFTDFIFKAKCCQKLCWRFDCSGGRKEGLLLSGYLQESGISTIYHFAFCRNQYSEIWHITSYLLGACYLQTICPYQPLYYNSVECHFALKIRWTMDSRWCWKYSLQLITLGDQQFLKYPNHPVWHQQACDSQSCLNHIYSPLRCLIWPLTDALDPCPHNIMHWTTATQLADLMLDILFMRGSLYAYYYN